MKIQKFAKKYNDYLKRHGSYFKLIRKIETEMFKGERKIIDSKNNKDYVLKTLTKNCCKSYIVDVNTGIEWAIKTKTALDARIAQILLIEIHRKISVLRKFFNGKLYY